MLSGLQDDDVKIDIHTICPSNCFGQTSPGLKSVITYVLTLAVLQDIFTNKPNDLSVVMWFVTRYYHICIYFSFCVIYGFIVQKKNSNYLL